MATVQPRSSDPVRVVYIMGTGRSGSTILANILGAVDGWFSAGELRYLWQRGILEQRLCGCGLRFGECELWQAIMRAGFGTDGPDPHRVIAHQRSTGRARHAPRLLASRLGLPRAAAPAEYLRTLGTLYTAVAAVTGARVIVDSSKLPAYAAVLDQVRDLDVFAVHLVRDPRAAAHSWRRRKEQPDRGTPGYMVPQGPLQSTMLWDLWNTTAEAVWGGRDGRYLRIRYEDFAAEPEAVVRGIVAALGEPGAVLPFTGPRTVALGPNHSVAGNPNRLSHGSVDLRADQEYLGAMPRHTYALVTAVSAPLLARYGYPLVRTQSGTAHAGTTRVIGVQSMPAHRRLARRIMRHVEWARTQGVRRLVEEDQLNPMDRARAAVSRARWRRAHAVSAGQAMPVFVVGVQRSGTNMLTRGLDSHPAFEVHNENDGAAFDRFALRDLAVVRAIAERSRHRYVLFKPLIDSHRIDSVLDGLGSTTPGRAIWAFRAVDGRVRSALAKFGDNNLVVMREIAAGRMNGRWQAQGIAPATLELIRSLDWNLMSPESAAAMFWYVRNELFFSRGLDHRDDVLLSSYDELLAEPEQGMRRVCAFLGCPYEPALARHIEPGRARSTRLTLDPVVREQCDALQARLEHALHEQARRMLAA